MLVTALPYQATFERTIERIRFAARSLRVRDSRAERRRLAADIRRTDRLTGLIDYRLGYTLLPAGTIDGIASVMAYCQQIRELRRNAVGKKKRDYNPTILEPTRYEEAPPLFDFILSDPVLQLATDYLGEIPVLISIKLWCTPINEHLKGSQLYHRDGNKWLLRRAKFLFNMDDVDENCGPFTFLPADISARISKKVGTIKGQDKLDDAFIYRIAKPDDTISLIGPGGTGAMVDSSRCFHFGARVRRGERLLLQFNFLRVTDAVEGGPMRRTQGFIARFGDDPVRKLVIPNTE